MTDVTDKTERSKVTPNVTPMATPQRPRKPAGPRPQEPAALLRAVREAYGLRPDEPLSGEGTLAADVGVAEALWDHLEDPSLPRPHLPGDPPLRPLDPALKTRAARRTALSLGKQLHALRTAQGWSQQEAAAQLGWHPMDWARLEAGFVYPTLPILDLVASRLGVRVVLTADPAGLVISLEPVSAAA